MATQIALRSIGGSATAVELVGSRRGGGNVQQGSAWEERIYKMQFSDTTWNSFDVYNATGVPAYGAQLGSSNLYLLDKSAEPDQGDQCVAICRVRYETLRADMRQPHINATTSRWSVVKAINNVPTEKVIEKDVAGKPLVNCLGESFHPQIAGEAQDRRVSVRFVTNETSYASTLEACLDCVNNNTINMYIGNSLHTWQPGEVWFKEYSLSDTFDENGSKCTDINLSLMLRKNSTTGTADAWHIFRPNLSLFQAVSTSSPTTGMRPIMSSSSSGYSVPITEPKYLDSHGVVIPDGGTITMNEFTVKYSTDFSFLVDGLLN